MRRVVRLVASEERRILTATEAVSWEQLPVVNTPPIRYAMQGQTLLPSSHRARRLGDDAAAERFADLPVSDHGIVTSRLVEGDLGLGVSPCALQ